MLTDEIIENEKRRDEIFDNENNDYFCGAIYDGKCIMGNLKDFWTMTRRERQGTIIVLAVIALLLVSTMAVRSCNHSQEVVGVQSARVLEFEADVDSMNVTVEKKAQRAHGKKAKPKSTPRKKKDKSRPSAPSPQPRPLDPVPQF